MSAANCLIQYLHQVVRKSYGAVTAREEEAMKRAAKKAGAALHWDQMLGSRQRQCSMTRMKSDVLLPTVLRVCVPITNNTLATEHTDIHI